MKKKNKILSLLIIIIIISLIIIANKFNIKDVINSKANIAGNAVSSNQQIQITPLSPEEREKVAQILLSSEFIKDVPKKNPIALIFFKYENGQRIWQDRFLIGKNQLLTRGIPTIQLTLHSKYITEFNNNNLCEIFMKAKQNGDLGFQSEYSKAKLLIKYIGMLKHRSCFGV